MAGNRQAVYISVQMTPAEKRHLDAVVKASGKKRNRYLRELFEQLEEPEATDAT